MKEKNKITKDSIIRKIAERNDDTISNVRKTYNTLEEIIFETLMSVNEDSDVSIKLFEGVNLDGSFVPAKEKKNNLTGKTSHVDSKIKPKFTITRSYCEKLNKDSD